MTEVQSNFAALAAGEAGAPPLAVGSLMWSGVASGAFLNVSSGLQTTGVGSFGAVHVNSGYQTTGVGSFGALDVSSGIHIAGAAPSEPVADTLYKENIAKAWGVFDGSPEAILEAFNVVTFADNGGAGLYTVTLDTDFADGNYAIAALSKRDGANTSSLVWLDTVPVAGSFDLEVANTSAAGHDANPLCIICFGLQ
jgi:hypothetical protein